MQLMNVWILWRMILKVVCDQCLTHQIYSSSVGGTAVRKPLIYFVTVLNDTLIPTLKGSEPGEASST